MMTVTSSRAVMLIAVVAVLAAMVGVADTSDPTVLRLPVFAADAWRVLVMGQASFAVGLMFILVTRASKIRLDSGDQLTRPACALMLSYFMLALYVILQLASKLRSPFVAWTTPLGCAALLIADVALWKLAKRMGRMVGRAKLGILKLTLTDTSRPGPDIDLADGGPVVKR